MRAKQPLPDLDTIRQRLRGDGPLAEPPTLAGYLTGWLNSLEIDDNTIRGYESHVRVHLIPRLGDIPLDKLRAHHIRTMFAAIAARNAEIVAAKAKPRPGGAGQRARYPANRPGHLPTHPRGQGAGPR